MKTKKTIIQLAPLLINYCRAVIKSSHHPMTLYKRASDVPITPQIQPQILLRSERGVEEFTYGDVISQVHFFFSIFLHLWFINDSFFSSMSILIRLTRFFKQHGYKFLVHTWHRLTRVRICSPLSVSGGGPLRNCLLFSTVVSQKLYLLAK